MSMSLPHIQIKKNFIPNQVPENKIESNQALKNKTKGNRVPAGKLVAGDDAGVGRPSAAPSLQLCCTRRSSRLSLLPCFTRQSSRAPYCQLRARQPWRARLKALQMGPGTAAVGREESELDLSARRPAGGAGVG